MPRTRARRRVALSIIVLSCALAAQASAEDAPTVTTVVRTKGAYLHGGIDSYGDCVQRSLYVFAETNVSRTRVDGTRTVGEVNRTLINMSDYNICTNSYATFSVEWPSLDGVQWDTHTNTASVHVSRPVDVQRCHWIEETGQVCETRSEMLSVNMTFEGTGDFDDGIYVMETTMSGGYSKESRRSRNEYLDTVYDIQLNGQPITGSRTFGNLVTQRVGTLTTGPL